VKPPPRAVHLRLEARRWREVRRRRQDDQGGDGSGL